MNIWLLWLFAVISGGGIGASAGALMQMYTGALQLLIPSSIAFALTLLTIWREV